MSFGNEMDPGEVVKMAGNFPADYPLPNNQTAYTEALIERIDENCPEISKNLRRCLQQLEQFAIQDEHSGNHFFFSRLPIAPAREVPNPFVDNIMDAEHKEQVLAFDGYTAVGELSPESIVLIDGIYTLTGATTVRNDHEKGARSGIVVRKGEYLGEPIYIQESYDKSNEYIGGKSMLSLQILSPEDAQEAVNKLDLRETMEFQGISGLRGEAVGQAIKAHSVNPGNYQFVADALRKLVHFESSDKNPED